MTRYYTRGNFLKVAAASGTAFFGGPLLAAAPACAATHNGYVDSLTNRRMTQLTNWINWLAKTGAQGFIGEVEQPNNYNDRSKFTDQAQWAALADTYFTKCDSAGLVYTEQECSEQYYNTPFGGYHASIYRSARDGSKKSVSVPAYQSAVLERHAAAHPGMVGVNFSGGQKFDEGINSNTNPGTYNSLYWFPTANSNPVCPNTGMNSFQFLASRGIKIVRVGFRWERMQPSLNDALNPTELKHLKQCISNASAAGLSVIMDLHNYGGYCISSGRLALNSSALPVSAYQDVWKKLSAEFASEPTVVGYDIMNEPYAYGGIAAGSYGSAGKEWEAITQTVVDALRDLGDTTQINILFFLMLRRPPRKHTKPWIVNGGDIAYTSHDYWDDSSGDYRYDYSYYNRRVAKKGY